MGVAASTDAFLPLLREGDRKEIGKAGDVAGLILKAPAEAAALLDCLQTDDETVKSHAAHALMQIAKADTDVLQPHAERLLKGMGLDPQWEVREQFSKIIVQLDLTKPQAAEAARLFRAYLDDKSSIVRTCALQGLFDLAAAGLYPADKVKSVLEGALAHGSKAMAARARKLLEALG